MFLLRGHRHRFSSKVCIVPHSLVCPCFWWTLSPQTATSPQKWTSGKGTTGRPSSGAWWRWTEASKVPTGAGVLLCHLLRGTQGCDRRGTCPVHAGVWAAASSWWWSFGNGCKQWGETETPSLSSQKVSVCCWARDWQAALTGSLSSRVPGSLVCLAVSLVCLLIGNCIEINSHLPLPPSLCSSFLRKWGITVQLVRPVLSQIKQIQCLECGVRSWCFCVVYPHFCW